LLEELVVALALIPISGQMETSSGSPRRALLGVIVLKESTLTALNWMVTHHHFHPGPGGNDKASSEGMSHDIHKGDLEPGQMQKLGLNPNSWPPIQKPSKWSNPRRNVTTYGALLGSTFSGACEVEIEEQKIKDEVNVAGGYGALPPGFKPEEFHDSPTAEEAVTFLNKAAYQKEIGRCIRENTNGRRGEANRSGQEEGPCPFLVPAQSADDQPVPIASCRRNSTSTQFSMMQSVHLKLPTRPSVQTLRSMSDVFSD
jgi:hypothetical protein